MPEHKSPGSVSGGRPPAADWMSGARSIVILTGAGVSTDSGIPDFRGPMGAWTLNPGSEGKATYEMFLADPARRRRFWVSRRDHPVWRAEPNAGHQAISDLVGEGIGTAVITQNTDGLHQRAGTPPQKVIELHGALRTVVCIDCARRSAIDDAFAQMAAGADIPECLVCGGILKTDTVMSGQVVPPEIFDRAKQAVLECDVLLVVGTTLLVEPTASLCAIAVGAGAKLVIVNRDATPYDRVAAAVIREPISEALPRISRTLISRGGAAADPGPQPLDEPEFEPAQVALLEEWRKSAADSGIVLALGDVAGVLTAAMVCGAADESAARALLDQVPGLKNRDERTQLSTARWLRDVWAQSATDGGEPSAPYWDVPPLDAASERLVASVVAWPGFLAALHMETVPAQDRRSLAVLAAAAATHPELADTMSDLLSVLPGLAPTAIETALESSNPAPLAAALTELARRVPLPADLLDAVPRGSRVFGEFPVVLAESLVAAYEQRVERRPALILPILARTLSDLAERLTVLGKDAEAEAARRRAADARERLV